MPQDLRRGLRVQFREKIRASGIPKGTRGLITAATETMVNVQFEHVPEVKSYLRSSFEVFCKIGWDNHRDRFDQSTMLAIRDWCRDNGHFMTDEIEMIFGLAELGDHAAVRTVGLLVTGFGAGKMSAAKR